MNFFIESEMIHQSSCVNTPQQNEISKRKNRHVLEMAQVLVFTTNVSKYFWADAILTTWYLINQMRNHVLNYQTPLNRLLESYPKSHAFSTLDLETFSCFAFVHNHDQNRSKLGPRSPKCIFLGYSAT